MAPILYRMGLVGREVNNTNASPRAQERERERERPVAVSCIGSIHPNTRSWVDRYALYYGSAHSFFFFFSSFSLFLNHKVWTLAAEEIKKICRGRRPGSCNHTVFYINTTGGTYDTNSYMSLSCMQKKTKKRYYSPRPPKKKKLIKNEKDALKYWLLFFFH